MSSLRSSDLWRDDLFARKRQQVTGESRRGLGRVGDLGQVKPARMLGRQRCQAELEPSEDDRQQIVEVVRHAARQPPDRFHLLRLKQPILQPLSIGDIREGDQHLRERPGDVANRFGGDPEIKTRTVQADRWHLHLLEPLIPNLRQGDGRLDVGLPQVEEGTTEQALGIGVTPQPVQRGVGKRERPAAVGDGNGLPARAQHGVENAQALLGHATFGDVLNGANGSDGTPIADGGSRTACGNANAPSGADRNDR